MENYEMSKNPETDEKTNEKFVVVNKRMLRNLVKEMGITYGAFYLLLDLLTERRMVDRPWTTRFGNTYQLAANEVLIYVKEYAIDLGTSPKTLRDWLKVLSGKAILSIQSKTDCSIVTFNPDFLRYFDEPTSHVELPKSFDATSLKPSSRSSRDNSANVAKSLQFNFGNLSPKTKFEESKQVSDEPIDYLGQLLSSEDCSEPESITEQEPETFSEPENETEEPIIKYENESMRIQFEDMMKEKEWGDLREATRKIAESNGLSEEIWNHFRNLGNYKYQ